MTKSLALALTAAAAALAACSPPSAAKCAQTLECPQAQACVEGICQALGPALYVANSDESTITTFSLDPATGALTSPTTIPAGSHPTGLVVDPSGKYVVAANSDAVGGSWGGVGTISVYARSPTSVSGLAEIPGSPFPANTMALNVAITPDGRYVYTTNQNDFQVTTFGMDPATGALAQAGFSPLAEREAHSIAMHPSGRFFYTGAENLDIQGHVIAADGSYTNTLNSPYASAMANNSLSITPDGRFLYSVDAGSSVGGSGNIRGFAIDLTTGALTQLPWSPLLVLANEPLRTSTITPSGNVLYVGLWNTNAVAAYTISRATGALSPVPGMPFAAGTKPKALAVNGEGRFLYVANYGSSDVSAFSIDPATSQLTGIGTYPVGGGPKMLITAPGAR